MRLPGESRLTYARVYGAARPRQHGTYHMQQPTHEAHFPQARRSPENGLTILKNKHTKTGILPLISQISQWGTIITGYPIDGAMSSSVGGRVRKLSVICLHDNAIVAWGILVTILHCETPEPRLNAIYIVSSVGTSLWNIFANAKYPSIISISIRYLYVKFVSLFKINAWHWYWNVSKFIYILHKRETIRILKIVV